MPVNENSAQPLAAQPGEAQFLTINMVMPASGDTTEEAASLAGLLLALTVLAFERFSAGQKNPYVDAPCEPVPSSLAGIPVDPFDGQLLRFRKEDSGYEFHGTSPDVTDLPGSGDAQIPTPGGRIS